MLTFTDHRLGGTGNFRGNKVTRHDLGLAMAALAAPFKQPGAFLRCAALPFLVCMVFAGAVTLTSLAFPGHGGETEPPFPVWAQLIVFAMIALGMLSLVSFSINWRRSLGLGTERHDPASLLTIDGRSIAYLLVQFRRDPALPPETPDQAESWLKRCLKALGSMFLFLVLFVSAIVAIFAALIRFQPTQPEFSLFVDALMSCLFVALVFGTTKWRLRSAVALGIAPDSLGNGRIPARRSLPLVAFVALLLFTLSMIMPEAPDADEAQFLPYFGAWLTALLLTIGWFSAFETLAFVENGRRERLTTDGDEGQQPDSGSPYPTA